MEKRKNAFSPGSTEKMYKRDKGEEVGVDPRRWRGGERKKTRLGSRGQGESFSADFGKEPGEKKGPNTKTNGNLWSSGGRGGALRGNEAGSPN